MNGQTALIKIDCFYQLNFGTLYRSATMSEGETILSNKKVAIGVSALVIATLLIGAGVFAAFTDTETTGVDAQTGSLDITGAADVTVSQLAPGDLAFRDLAVDIPLAENDGDLIQSIRVSVPTPDPGNDVVGAPSDTGDTESPPPGESLLSGTDGLQVLLATCNGGIWTLPSAGDALGGDADVNGVDDSATCTGTITVTQTEIPLNDLVDAVTFEYEAADFGVTPTATGTIPDGTSLNLVAQFRLPSAANNAYENASLTIDLVFEAIQRAGVIQ